MSEPDPTAEGLVAGPLLYFRGASEGRTRLAALTVVAEGAEDPAVVADGGPAPGRTVMARRGMRVVRYAFDLPSAADAGYSVNGRAFGVNCACDGDLRIAYVSCNGQETGDLDRPPEERNRLWAGLGRLNAERPFHLLLQGGDQIYADEAAEADPLSRDWLKGRIDRPGADALARADAALRDAFFERYVALLRQPQIAEVMARVPSLAMWDDHDICDGWGSLPAESLDAPVGRTLFAAARDHFVLFQLGADPAQGAEIVVEPESASLTWRASLPGLDVIAPDLRSERRPRRVMGPDGWRSFGRALDEAGEGRVLVLSSVPALGPRLSWIEALMKLTRRMEKYEDDLRDQWQSRVHRAEWRRLLSRLAEVHAVPGKAVTVLSGEIHLATQGEMETPPAPLRQLVASGVTHPPPPRLYAAALGLLARFGEEPLRGRRITLSPLPGRRAIYAAERNFLVLERREGRWSAVWELEESGPTPPLAI